jgi:pimeloyl-ACP methyl ester carboxylesterase
VHGGHTALSHANGSADGPQIVLVHGVGLGAESMRPLADALAPTAQVTRIELPGFGDTPRQDPIARMQEQSAFLAAFLSSRGMARVVLVGHSMGAGVAAGVAADHPSLVQRLVLIGPVTDPRARTMMRQGVRLLVDTCLESPATNLVVLHEYVKCGVRRYVIALADMLRFDLDAVAPRIHQPTLIVRGLHDPIAPRRWCESVVRRFPSGRLVHIEGGAHVVLQSHPKRVASAIRSFTADSDR